MSYRRGRRAFMGEINVTPFVDVMLVLLIIFMVSASVRHQGLKVDLPRTKMVEALPMGKDHFVLTLLADGTAFLDQMEIPRPNMVDYLIQQVSKQKKRLYLRADKNVSHGEVIKVLGQAREAGIVDVSLVAEDEEIQ